MWCPEASGCPGFLDVPAKGQGGFLAQPLKWALHQTPWHRVLSGLSVFSPGAKQNLQLAFLKGVKESQSESARWVL